MSLLVRVLLLSMLSAPAVAAAPGRFSEQGLAGWTEQTFEGKARTAYRLVRETGVPVLEAQCQASASGWIWKARIDLRQTPILRWRWQTAARYAGLDERSKTGDDFPARVYVVVDGGWAVWRTRSLVYVWASEAAQGADWPSPYTRQAHIVVLRSGPGGWQDERRDVRADFKRYFGLDLAAADGVAVMTDCDDAGGSGGARYGDLRFEKPPG